MRRNIGLGSVATVFTLILTGAPAFAQDAPLTETEIVVTGRGLDAPPGTPAYGSVVLDPDRLANDASGRLETLLADVAGFQQFRRSDSRSANPSAQGATLRALGGNATSRTLVLLDGVPQADPFFGYIPFSALVPDRLASVRVTRGGGSGAFGSGAVAGTIEATSAGADQLPPVAASAFYGSRDASELSAALAPRLGAGFATVSARRDRGDGFFTTPERQRVAASVPAAYDSWSVALRGVAPLDPDVELQARVAAFRDARTLRFAGADSLSEGQDASLRIVSRGRWALDALAYVQARNFANVVISATSFRKTLDQRATPSTGYGGKIELRPPVGGGHVLRIGADLRIADGRLAEDAYSALTGLATARRAAGGMTRDVGLFVEDDWSLGALTLTGGARADRWSITQGFFREANAAGAITTDDRFATRSGWAVTGRGGAILRTSDAVALRGAAYSGIRVPTPNELYRPFVVFPVTTQANATLVPEILRGAEVGVDLVPAPGVTLGATLFVNQLRNAVANVTIAPNLRQRQNVDAVLAKGVELTGAVSLGAFDLAASYAYSDARLQAEGALDGKRPAQSPRHAASATLGWQRGGARLSGTLRYVGAQYEDDLETDILPDALTADAFVSLSLRRDLALVARAENLFDAHVVTRNQGGSIDLGTPRTLWIGVRVGG